MYQSDSSVEKSARTFVGQSKHTQDIHAQRTDVGRRVEAVGGRLLAVAWNCERNSSS
jgi:hypothetical protein